MIQIRSGYGFHSGFQGERLGLLGLFRAVFGVLLGERFGSGVGFVLFLELLYVGDAIALGIFSALMFVWKILCHIFLWLFL